MVDPPAASARHSYLTDTDRLATACYDVDEDWLKDFRKWPMAVPDRVVHRKERQQEEFKRPGAGESGMKLVCRSVAHIARERLGERDWIEEWIMLGHRKTSTADTYAPFTVGCLGRAFQVTDQIIDEIERLCPQAFAEPCVAMEPE